MLRKLIFNIVLVVGFNVAVGQEVILPAEYNPATGQAFQSKSFKAGQQIIHLNLPFFEDFRNSGPFPDPQKWSDRNVYINQGFAYFPPNYGVATFDALDSTGHVYKQANYASFEADKLTSHPIRLDSLFKPVKRAIKRSDSLYFSFFYQPQGRGNFPQVTDSLILYFYSPKDSAWYRVWAKEGMPIDTFKIKTGKYWEQVLIWISDSAKYYHKDFRFRFVAYASLANNLLPSWQSSMDHWNVDYIYLNYNRYLHDTTFRHLNFVDVSASMLKHYHSMPYTQYSNDPTREMNDTLFVQISNLDKVAHPSNYGYTIFDGTYQKIYAYNGGGYAVYPVYDSGYVKYKPYARPRITSILPIDPLGIKDSADFIVRHVIVGDFTPGDKLFDTLEIKQIFRNYFAYDDGTPEAGYGVTPAGAMAAVRYTLNAKDTLRAVKIYFNPTQSKANEQYFHLLVWDDNNGIPGNLLFDTLVRPDFSKIPHGFNTFILKKIVIVRNAFFVGWMNTTNDNLNIGFDYSRDNRHNQYFNIDGNWRPSQFKGSLMIRPLVGKALQGSPQPAFKSREVKILPNPIVGRTFKIFVPGDADKSYIDIFSLSGQHIMRTQWQDEISVTSLVPGIYLLKVTYANGQLAGVTKLIINK